MEWLKKIMKGRYGLDELGLLLFIITFLLSILSFLTHLIIIRVCILILIGVFYFRILSKNYYKRQQENFKFLRLTSPIKKYINLSKQQLKQRKDYKFFICPKCHQALRVPKGKGKICITCPKCKNELHKRT